MIDAEATIFSTLVERIHAKYPWADQVTFLNDYIIRPEEFPTVTFTEEDNRTEIRFHDTSHEENAARLTYQVDVWSNAGHERKTEARFIMKAIDDELLEMGFRRTYLNNQPEIQDNSVYRCIGRYTTICEEKADGSFVLYHRR